MPALKRNILNFGYDFNFKYEGMCLHSFDRFYVVAKFILPMINDIQTSPIISDIECNYLNIQLDKDILAVIIYLISKFLFIIIPFIYYYKKQVDYFNQMVYHILTKEIPLILLAFKKIKKEKRGIITMLITGCIGLAYEEIFSYLHSKRLKALQKEFNAMERWVNLERN